MKTKYILVMIVFVAVIVSLVVIRLHTMKRLQVTFSDATLSNMTIVSDGNGPFVFQA